MDNDDGFMIIGAKKKNDVKNPDKHDLDTCAIAFKKFILSNDGSINREFLIDMCVAGEIDKNLIRATTWKLLLNVLPIDKKN